MRVVNSAMKTAVSPISAFSIMGSDGGGCLVAGEAKDDVGRGQGTHDELPGHLVPFKMEAASMAAPMGPTP